jgi:LmbE family N-acetylglucosaminyl deacetylase
LGLRMMCVVAHPDDECFAFGGALALAAKQGVETYVICLTDGQAASNRGEASSGEDLGRMRREEFAASCNVLGVSRYELLDYQDARLEFENFSDVAGRIVAKMRDYKPHVVLTFSPDGALNTHPDHTMVSSFTNAAFHWAASAKRYPEAGPVHHAERLYLLSTSFFMEGRPAPMPPPWTVTLDVREVMAQKQEAFRQHSSQAPLMEQTKSMFEEFGHNEHYILAATREPQPATHTDSFFEGIAG